MKCVDLSDTVALHWDLTSETFHTVTCGVTLRPDTWGTLPPSLPSSLPLLLALPFFPSYIQRDMMVRFFKRRRKAKVKVLFHEWLRYAHKAKHQAQKNAQADAIGFHNGTSTFILNRLFRWAHINTHPHTHTHTYPQSIQSQHWYSMFLPPLPVKPI